MKALLRVLALSPLLLLLTGCWSAVSLNNRALVTGIAVDPGTTRAYKVTAQISAAKGGQSSGDAGSGSASQSAKVISVSGEGDTLSSALVPIRSQIAKDLYLPLMHSAILSDKLPPKLLQGAIYEMMRIPNIEPVTLLAVAHGAAAEEVIKATATSSESASSSLYTSFIGIRRQDSLRTQLWQYYARSSSPYQGVFLPTVSSQKGSFTLRGFALMDGGAIRDFVEKPEEIDVFTMLTGRMRKAALSVQSPIGPFGLETRSVRSSKHYVAGGTSPPHFVVTLAVRGVLVASPVPIDGVTMDVRKVSQLAADNYTKTGTALLRRIQATGSDPFNLQETYTYSQHRTLDAAALKKIYRETPIFLNVHVSILSRGVIT